MRVSRHAASFIIGCLVMLFATAVYQRVSNPSPEFHLDAPQNAGSGHDHPPLAPEDAAALGVLMEEMRGTPKDPAIPLRIADLFIRNKDWLNAAAFLEKSAELAPENHRTWHLLGFVRSRQGAYAQAAEAFEKAAAISPEPETLFSLGVMYRYHLRMPQKALTHFTAAANSPKSDISLRQRAENELSSLRSEPR